MEVPAELTPVSMRSYDRAWLSTDVIAGVTLAAVAIPETMGYTSIAQTPIVTGLYTVIFPTVFFALLGASQLLVVGADSATAAILAAGLLTLSVPGLTPNSPEWVAYSSLIALICGGHAVPRAAAPAGVPRRLPVRVGADRLPHRRRHPGAHRPDPRHARDPEGNGQLARAAVALDHVARRHPAGRRSRSRAATIAIIVGVQAVPARRSRARSSRSCC